MKTLLHMISFLMIAGFTTGAAAQSYNLEDSDVALTAIAGDITEVSPLCPEDVTCIANGTVVTIEFELLGCLDRLGPVTYRTESTDDGRLVLNISAYNIHDRRSLAAFCAEMPTETYTISLVSQYGDVEAYFLGTDAGLVTPIATEDLQSVIECMEPVDHGARVAFLADAEGTIRSAIYTETTFVDTQVISQMNACRTLPAPQQSADEIYQSVHCNDSNWVNSYEVELYEGGFANVPSVKVYRGPTDRTLVHNLQCSYVQ